MLGRELWEQVDELHRECDEVTVELCLDGDERPWQTPVRRVRTEGGPFGGRFVISTLEPRSATVPRVSTPAASAEQIKAEVEAAPSVIAVKAHSTATALGQAVAAALGEPAKADEIRQRLLGETVAALAGIELGAARVPASIDKLRALEEAFRGCLPTAGEQSFATVPATAPTEPPAPPVPGPSPTASESSGTGQAAGGAVEPAAERAARLRLELAEAEADASDAAANGSLAEAEGRQPTAVEAALGLTAGGAAAADIHTG